MSRIRALLVALIAIGLIAGPMGAPAQAAGPDSAATPSAKSKKSKKAKKKASKAKKKCKKLKGKKKSKCLKNAGKGKGGNPWDGSPYKPGMVCSTDPKEQKKYAKYGLICIVIHQDPYLTTLTPL